MHKFSKSKVNKIRRNLYEIENKKNLSEVKIKKIEKNINELEKNLCKKKSIMIMMIMIMNIKK